MLRTSMSGRTCFFSFLLAGVAFAQTQPDKGTVKRDTTVTKEKTRNGVTVSKTWQKSTEIVGSPISSDGKNVGKFEDLVVDVNTGRVVYGVGSLSSVEGSSGRLYAIPWPAVRYSTETRTYNLPVETTRIQAAPSFTASDWPNFADEDFATRTYKYYNVTPSWRTERSVIRTADRPTTTTTTYAPGSTTVTRVSELRGRTIRTPDGMVLGQINEIVLDPATGRVQYAVTTRDGQSVPIPWTALHVGKGNDFEVTITADQWKAAPVIETTRWSTISDPVYTQEVYRYYKAKPVKDDDDDDDEDDDD